MAQAPIGILLKNLLNLIYSWHPKPPFFYGWLVLGVAAVGAFIAASVSQTVLAGVQDLIAQDMEWDRKTIALAATLGTWISGMTMPFIGRLVDRFGPRWMMLSAAILVGVGLIFLSESQTIWQFFFAYIIVRSIAGPNLQNLIPRTIAVNFFSKRRNLAMGITSLNRIASESVNIQIITALSTAFSWRSAYRILGLTAIPLSLPIFLMVRHKPEDVGQLPDGASSQESGQLSSSNGAKSSKERKWPIREIISLPSFWFILTAEFVAVSATSMVVFQLVPFLVDGGMTQVAAAGALTLGNLLGGMTVPLWGWLTDRFTIKKIAILIVLTAILPTLLFMMVTPLSLGFPLVVTWTAITGAVNVLGSMMLGTVFNRGSFGTVTGITGPSRTAAMGLGPTAGALVASWRGSYNPIFVTAAVGYILVIILYSSVKTENSPL
ncbi:uncharacterized protein METZ01_LOCUS106041 [marine metagenome]|uniref:Major facilitator superfamily (MFS) profile domain-containing protein n=1 Tax=marine metagenome TaxID=408172 RepID=A0A381WMJ1_9ZZZZ